jgi:hypothetical protein
VAAVGNPLTEPGPDNILHLPVPVVGVKEVIVLVGDDPHIVCNVGVTTGLLFSGSTLIVAVIVLLGQVLPNWLTTTYCTVLLPTPKPMKFAVVVNAPMMLPVPVNMLQLFVPVVGVNALSVALGVAPHIVWVKGLITGLLVSGSTLILAVTLLFGQLLPGTPITY